MVPIVTSSWRLYRARSTWKAASTDQASSDLRVLLPIGNTPAAASLPMAAKRTTCSAGTVRGTCTSVWGQDLGFGCKVGQPCKDGSARRAKIWYDLYWAAQHRLVKRSPIRPPFRRAALSRAGFPQVQSLALNRDEAVDVLGLSVGSKRRGGLPRSSFFQNFASAMAALCCSNAEPPVLSDKQHCSLAAHIRKALRRASSDLA